MPFVKALSINHENRPYFPWGIPSCRLCGNIALNGNVTFLTGDNGVGKSTLLESLALKLKHLNVPTIMPTLKDSEAAQTVMHSLDINLVREPLQAHLIRAEDLGRKIEKYYAHVDTWAKKMDVDENIDELHIKTLIKNELRYLPHAQGPEITHKYDSCSHGEAYLDSFSQALRGNGMYLIDEPEAALSPIKQIALISMIMEHLSLHSSQFVIATHSPILMSTPNSQLYEITEDSFQETDYRDTEHYQVTLGFLQNPESYLRFLQD